MLEVLSGEESKPAMSDKFICVDGQNTRRPCKKVAERVMFPPWKNADGYAVCNKHATYLYNLGFEHSSMSTSALQRFKAALRRGENVAWEIVMVSEPFLMFRENAPDV